MTTARKFLTAIELPGNPSAALQAVPKQYCDLHALGCLARGRRTTNSTGTTATLATSGQGIYRLPGVALTAGRLYRVGAFNVGFTSTVAGDLAGTQLTYTTDGSTPTVSSTILTLGAISMPVAGQVYGTHISAEYPCASNQTFTVLLSYWRQNGTGTVTCYGNAIWPVDLTIEDIGPDPGSTGTAI